MIGYDVWFGGNVVVNLGVMIGSNVVIGFGFVVIYDILDNVVVVGNFCYVLWEIIIVDYEYWVW